MAFKRLKLACTGSNIKISTNEFAQFARFCMPGTKDLQQLDQNPKVRFPKQYIRLLVEISQAPSRLLLILTEPVILWWNICPIYGH